jgi:carbamoyltransferase
MPSSSPAHRSALRPGTFSAATHAPLTIGLSGSRQNAAVSLSVDGQIVAFCEQERVTRVRRAGLLPGRLPAEAIDAVLGCLEPGTGGSIAEIVTAEDLALPPDLPAKVSRVGHHRAHAATAFYLSPFDAAAVLICDSQSSEATSVWTGAGGALSQEDWGAASASSFAAVYEAGAGLFGFGHERLHDFEALARLEARADAGALGPALRYENGALQTAPDWEAVVRVQLGVDSGNSIRQQARVASAFQSHMGALLLALAGDVRRRTSQRRLCLGGGLFYNTYFTTLIRQSGLFDDVFVAPNPGNAGLAIGAILDGAPPSRRQTSTRLSPFLGPEYLPDVIKATLDNCKLSYEYLGECELIEATVRALTKGALVGWFQGRMEWTHRALGHRSILASPVSPYVLDNLNVFLKHRPPYRAYGLSIPVDRAAEFFDGPPTSAFMEYEYRPRDPELFKHVMPAGVTSLRLQTLDEPAAGKQRDRFDTLHRAFGRATGVPALVNTSFNGLSEPMVCSPRDAIRVFFGTGLDVLVMDGFIVRK